MKKICFFILLCFGLSSNIHASDYSSNLIVYAEDGQKFYLFLNGIRQNLVAGNMVKITKIPLFSVNIRIVFEDTTIQSIYKKSVIVQDDRGQDLEVRYHIHTTPEKLRSLIFAISMPILVAPATDPGATELPFSNKILPPIITLPKATLSSSSTNNAVQK